MESVITFPVWCLEGRLRGSAPSVTPSWWSQYNRLHSSNGRNRNLPEELVCLKYNNQTIFFSDLYINYRTLYTAHIYTYPLLTLHSTLCILDSAATCYTTYYILHSHIYIPSTHTTHYALHSILTLYTLHYTAHTTLAHLHISSTHTTHCTTLYTPYSAHYTLH